MKYTAGALFAGIGGFCAGFKRAGIETLWAIDVDEKVEQTYSLNYPEYQFIRDDVYNVAGRMAGGSKLQSVDVLHAGFPCQSFSQAGNRQGFDDPRGRLFFELIRIIGEFEDNKPPILIFENTPYLKIGQRGEWFERVKTEIQKLGYWFKDSNAIIIDPREHLGLPQSRPRLFMIALSKNHFRSSRFQIHQNQKIEPTKLSEFIDFDGTKDDQYYLNPENRYHEMIAQRRKRERETLYQLRKYVVRTKDHCPTLTANMGLGGHNVPFLFDKKGLRKLTEMECAKLQGFDNLRFPDEFFSGAKYLQIGNAVHADVAHSIGRSVKEKLETLHG